MIDPAKLLQLIAASPQIRTMELADKLDHDIDAVEAALDPLLAAGTVVPIPVIAPSGRNATGYQLSEAARAARIHAAPAINIDTSNVNRAIGFIMERGTVVAGQLHAFLGLKPNELVSRELAPALADGRLVKSGGDWSIGPALELKPVAAAPKAGASPEIQTAPRQTNPVRAVEYLKAQPEHRCTNDEMRTALDLPAGAQVSAYLKVALRDGSLHRAGLDWVLGAAPAAEPVPFAAKPAPAVAPLDSVESVGNIIVATKDASPIPQAVVDAVAAAPVVEQLATAPAPVAVALATLEDPPEALTFGPLATKETNPKDMVGVRKAPMSTVPGPVMAEIGVAMLEGAAKYGRHNYRAMGVRASVYYDATMRHLMGWWEGEDIDVDSGLSHVTKAIASLVVMRDAMIQSMFTDDRPPRSATFYPGLNAGAAAIIDKYADRNPTHYTIKDEL